MAKTANPLEYEAIESPFLSKLNACLPLKDKFPTGASKVCDFLYLGGEEEAYDIKLLKSLGITHVINCAADYVTTGENYYQSSKISYLEFFAQDELGYDMVQHYDDAYKFIETARKAGGKVFIHCIAGVNRSGTITVIYIMQHKDIGPISAALWVRNCRGMVLTNRAFQRQVITFARRKNYLCLDKEKLASSAWIRNSFTNPT